MKTIPALLRSRPRVAVTVVLGLAVLLAAGLSLRSQQTPATDPVTRDRDVMKFKLHYAQGILEAITMENFPLLATNANKLAALTKEMSWRIRHTPEYDRLTADLRRQTDLLAKAAREQNADAATVAYFQMTVSCVTCHKYLRGQGVVLPP